MPQTNPQGHPVWTVAEAKAKLSEVLRLATEEPQYIGTKQPFVVISEEQWKALSQPKETLGQWIFHNMSDISDLEFPSRQDPDRDLPFHEN